MYASINTSSSVAAPFVMAASPSECAAGTFRAARRQRASTQDAYARDVQRWQRSFGGTLPCDTDLCIAYIVQQCKRVAPKTILRRLMAIQDAHLKAGFIPPTGDPRVREAMRLLTSGQQPLNLLPAKTGKATSPATRHTPKVAKPITRALLTRMLDIGTGQRTLDRRDKAILLLGASGLKRGLIAALDISSISLTEDAMMVRLATGEDGTVSSSKPRVVAIPRTRGPLCAATAVQQWIDYNDLAGKEGPLFPRCDRSGDPIWTERLAAAWINRIVRSRLAASGVADCAGYSAESLRKGYALETLKGRP